MSSLAVQMSGAAAWGEDAALQADQADQADQAASAAGLTGTSFLCSVLCVYSRSEREFRFPEALLAPVRPTIRNEGKNLWK